MIESSGIVPRIGLGMLKLHGLEDVSESVKDKQSKLTEAIILGPFELHAATSHAE